MSAWPATVGVQRHNVLLRFYLFDVIEYVDGEGDDEDDIVSKLYGSAHRELMLER